MIFKNRADAGRALAKVLDKYRGENAIIYALPRGGVVTGYEIAHALHLTLDLVIARKIGHPQNPEYAVCAVTENGPLVCDEAERALLDDAWLARAVVRERDEAKRRRRTYLADRLRVSAEGKIAILVDDGVATGLTMRAALAALKAEKPTKIVIAVPCAPAEVAALLRREADEVIVLAEESGYLGAVGAYYEHFPQVSDEEVISLLSGTVS